jgi:hypothetical protein
LIEGSKLSNFKIGGPILQNDENRGAKAAIKPTIFVVHLLPYIYYLFLHKIFYPFRMGIPPEALFMLLLFFKYSDCWH